MAALALGAGLNAALADEVVTRTLSTRDFQRAHEAVVEAIESEGLVVSGVVQFNHMLKRTATDLKKSGSPFAEAEVIQFCSTSLAWQLVEEAASQLSFCPLSIALYSPQAEPSAVRLSYRQPAATSPGRISASRLLEKLAESADQLAR